MKKYRNVLIYGAGASGVLIKQLFDKNNLGDVKVFVDDNVSLSNKTLIGVNIMHASLLDNDYILNNSIDAIVLSNINVHYSKYDALQEFRVPILLPKDLDKWNNGILSVKDIIELDSSFLINRSISQNLDLRLLGELENKRILITGAAGSIGSEIVRQLNKLKSISLILVDINESGLHDLFNTLENKESCTYHICDVSNLQELERIVGKYDRINSVFHAAAYKHVPLVEVDPYPGIRVNIQGTLNLCMMVKKYEIDNFTLISTDKAVNPTNVMGASKRCAELITNYYNGNNSSSLYRCTRFGNVIGSRGSAIPIFIEQIKKGGPITLTHAEMTRYFMTIPEATQLVIKSSLLQNEDGIFLFDMGESIKLTDIIKNLISYYEVKDVKIKITGLRSGEKLYEELSSLDEEVEATTDDKISLINSVRTTEIVMDKIIQFLKDFDKLSILELKDNLKIIIPEYSYLV